MADCSYARCVQERRLIKRELQKWTKNMVYIVGLERVAEELMGRRKWKLYQDILTGKNINAETTTTTATENIEEKLTTSKVTEEDDTITTKIQHSQLEKLHLNSNHIKENESVTTIKGETLIDNNIKKEEEAEINHSDNEDLHIHLKEELNKKSNTEEQNTSTLLNNNNINNVTSACENHQNLPTPIDWKPQDKCYFCVDGKLLKLNEKGDLVTETGPAPTESELISTIIPESDSDSSASSDTEVQRTPQGLPANRHVAANLFRGAIPPNMTSFESMAMAVAQFQGLQQGLQGLPNVPGLAALYPGLWYQQIANQMSPVIPQDHAPTTSPSQPPTSTDPPSSGGGGVAGGSGGGGTGEQPLDLSAKPSTSGTPVSDPKHIFKAKPRLTTVTGRRTYTEEELQNALQDILSGKLGTRRAAVLYGIPRSTLRNKVYKYAMEQKREALVNATPNVQSIDADDDDKDSGAEDDKDMEKLNSGLSNPADGMHRLSSQAMAAAAMQNYMKMYDNSNSKPENSISEPPKPTTSAPSPQTPPPANPWMQDPNILIQLQSLLLTGSLPGMLSQKPEEMAALPELLRKLMEQQELIKQQMKNSVSVSENANNGPASQDPRFAMQNLMYLQQQQQQPHHLHHNILHSKLRKSDTPETASSAELNDSEDNMILKIPSYKSAKKGELPSPSQGAKNGENLISPPLPMTVRPLLSGSPQHMQSLHSQNHLSVISPSLMHSRSESLSPPGGMPGKNMLSLSEVIAKSISKNFQQHTPIDALKHPSQSAMDHHMDHYKRPTISVIKNLGGTDISRFGSNPNISQMNRNSVSPGLTGTGGKGTRPKRGKYRNYDRDSLVEAVKAVQRGEMSVHRAGSYYGVPHSTLEYKVKERHLMRPRKREPKPQPLDSPGGIPSSSAIGASPSTSAANIRPIDKTKPLQSPPTPKLPHKTSPFPSSPPNGLKMFDSAMAAQLQYTSQLFWPPHPGFSGLPNMDYPRTPNSSTPQFPPNAENFFASQMMQRFQDDATRTSQNKSNGSQPKSAREIAESLYDASNTNGSFLDGIIRQTLDKKPGEVSHGALFEQLVKNNRTGSHEDEMRSLKRTGSPVDFAHNDIKRECPSPTSSTDNERDSSTDREHSNAKDTMENLIKLREGLTLRMDDDKRSDLNGTSSIASGMSEKNHPFHLKTEIDDEDDDNDEDDDEKHRMSPHDDSS